MNRGTVLGLGLVLMMGAAPRRPGLVPGRRRHGPGRFGVRTRETDRAAKEPPTRLSFPRRFQLTAREFRLPVPSANTPGPRATLARAVRQADERGPAPRGVSLARKDRKPVLVQKTPPAPITERPAVDPPSANAQWIEGYWEWDAGRKDFVWVTGTWRVAPPGRFWVNGYWKRDQQGWYRVPGFWTRSQDRPARLPQERSSPGSPGRRAGRAPGGRLLLRPRPVLPRWRRRGLEEGLLGQGPARLGLGARPVDPAARRLGLSGRLLGPHARGPRHPVRTGPGRQSRQAHSGDLTYQPYTQVSPEMYGQLYGAFGRPNS